MECWISVIGLELGFVKVGLRVRVRVGCGWNLGLRLVQAIRQILYRTLFNIIKFIFFYQKV